jgi:hypothetical protein
MDEALELMSYQSFPRETTEGPEIVLRKKAHIERCRKLPAVRPEEVEQWVVAFLAAHNVTRCSPAYAAPVQ